ncbi:MAG: hypothetical protein OHK0046_46470 [Anaerolineae bacterium]
MNSTALEHGAGFVTDGPQYPTRPNIISIYITILRQRFQTRL